MSETGRKTGTRIVAAVLIVVGGPATGAWLAPSWAWPPQQHEPVTRVALPSATPTITPDLSVLDSDVGPSDQPQEPAAVEMEPASEALDPVAAAAEMAAARAAGRPVPARAGQTGSGEGMIPITFDLNRPGGGAESVSGEAIVVRKAVRVNNREAGSLPIHVDAGSRLLVDRAELASVLSQAGMKRELRKPRGGKGLLSFSELRNDGIDLRYDPTSDSVLITTG